MQIICLRPIFLDGKTNVYYDGRYLTISWKLAFPNVTARAVFIIRRVFLKLFNITS